MDAIDPESIVSQYWGLLSILYMSVLERVRVSDYPVLIE